MSGSATGAGDVSPDLPDGPQAARSGRTVVLVHAAVTLLGLGFLLWEAQPFAGAVSESLPNAGGWQLLAASAVLVGGIGGLLEGLALRCRHLSLAVAVLLAVSVPGIWMPLLTVGRWFPEQQGDLISTGELIGGLVGWLMFMAAIAAAARAVAGPRRVAQDG